MKPPIHAFFEPQVQDALDPDRRRVVASQVTAMQIRLRFYMYNGMTMPTLIPDIQENTLVNLNEIDMELDGVVPQDIAAKVM